MKKEFSRIKRVTFIGLLFFQVYFLSFFLLFEKVHFSYIVEGEIVKVAPVGISLLVPRKGKMARYIYVFYKPLIKYYEWKKLACIPFDAEEFLGCKDCGSCDTDISGDE